MKLILFVTCLCLGFPALAQNQISEIDSIVNTYEAYLDQAKEEEMEDYVPTLKTTCHLIKRAIGGVNHEITIYYDRNDFMKENEQSVTEIYYATVRKVIFRLNSGSYDLVFSYYFNESGQLIKYRENATGYACHTLNMYFDQSKCIKIAQKANHEICESDEEIPNYERIKLNEKDLENAEIILKEAEKFTNLLNLQYTLLMEK